MRSTKASSLPAVWMARASAHSLLERRSIPHSSSVRVTSVPLCRLIMPSAVWESCSAASVIFTLSARLISPAVTASITTAKLMSFVVLAMGTESSGSHALKISPVVASPTRAECTS